MNSGGVAPVPDILDDNALTIYTDGSCFGAPRRGGIGIHFVWVNNVGDEEIWDHSLPATFGANNQEMELEAPIEALRLVDHRAAPFDPAQFNKIVIRTDSLYVYEHWKNAAWTWRQSKWTTKGGAAVLHTGSWKSLIGEMQNMSNRHRLVVYFEWVNGKRGKHAKLADKLAKQSSNNPTFAKTRPHLVRRKKTKERVEPGSVKVTGQTMTIHVVVARRLQAGRGYLYTYEVTGEEDPFKGRADRAQSDANLEPGRTYIVRMNDQQENPRIEEVLQEVVEDLTPYTDALKALGSPSTAQQVADEIAVTIGIAVTSAAVKRRLDQLVEAGQIFPTRSKGAGRPYVYALAGVPAEWHGDA